MISWIRTYFTFALFVMSTAIFGQSLNGNWNSELNISLQQFLDCKSKNNDNAECSKFIGESLQTVYKVNDFYSPKLGRHLMVSEIFKMLGESGQWKMIGHGYEQQALEEAQKNANARKAVIALYINASGAGHIAIILPGELQPSGSWGLNVPNSASFLLMEPQRSYVGKGLSYAFTKNHLKDVVLYARNY